MGFRNFRENVALHITSPVRKEPARKGNQRLYKKLPELHLSLDDLREIEAHKPVLAQQFMPRHFL